MIKHQNRMVFLLGILFGILLSVGYVNPYGGEINLSELVLQLSGSRGEFALGLSAEQLVTFAMKMTPVWIMEAYLGIALYRHFCTASIYVFSRCPNRGKWYWKEMFYIGCNVFFFQSVLVISAIITTNVRYQIQCDRVGMGLAVYHILIHSLWMYAAIVLINLLSLKMGSSMSFMIVMIIQAAGIATLGFVKALERLGDEKMAIGRMLLRWNPISHLVLGWQNSYSQSIQNVLENTMKTTEVGYLESSLLILLLGNICILIIGAVVIKKYDLLISDAEMGVA